MNVTSEMKSVDQIIKMTKIKVTNQHGSSRAPLKLFLM